MTINTMHRTTLVKPFRHQLVAALLITTLAGVTQAHEPSARLAAAAANTWSMIDAGGVTAPVNITSYSGGWYDPEYHQFCIFGGGHWDYSGNETWCFDIATLSWKELYPPDVVTRPGYDGADQLAYNNYDNKRYPGVLFNPAGESIENAAPMSRHTYDQVEYVDGLGPYMWGGVTWGDEGTPWCLVCPDSWVLRFKDRRWTYLYEGTNPAPNEPGAGASAYAGATGMLYAKVKDQTWTYDPRKNRWSQISTRGTPPPYTIEGTLEYDSRRNVLYFFGGNYEPNLTLWRFDIAKQRWSQLKPAGSGPDGNASNGPGMAYDSANDVLLIYYAGTIWAYHPEQDRWETRRPEIRPGDNDYVFGRFRYDPVNKGAWLHGWENDRHTTWFYRYR